MTVGNDTGNQMNGSAGASVSIHGKVTNGKFLPAGKNVITGRSGQSEPLPTKQTHMNVDNGYAFRYSNC